MTSKAQITLFEKLSLISTGTRAIALAVFRLTTAPFRKGPKANRPLKDALFAGLRSLSANVTAAQETWHQEGSSTMKEYLAYTKQKKLEPEVTELDSGLKLCWFGPKDAKNVMLYLHGGGYVGAATPGHVRWVADLQRTCSKDASFSVVLVAYTLSTLTSGRYPVQLQEAAEALHWLVEKHGKNPGDIILAGDSAGGHLCLSLLSHLLHPHPEAIKIDLKEPLLSVILISPWVSFQLEDASYARNAHSDFLTPKALQRWSSLYRNTSIPDNYNEPIRADVQWFAGLDKIAKDILIWAGGAEVLIDSIEKFAKTMESSHSGTKLVVQHGAAHVDPIIDLMLGYGKSEGTALIEEWTLERM